ncbi:MAG: hypothetical protein Fur005_13220 [Roseiflexaceae bacterium]
MPERLTAPQPMLIATVAYQLIPPTAWPALIARIYRSGANTLAINPIDAHDTALLRDLLDCCCSYRLPIVWIDPTPRPIPNHVHALSDHPAIVGTITDQAALFTQLAEWPTDLGVILVPDAITPFRHDGSATIHLWQQKPLLQLLHTLGAASRHAHPIQHVPNHAAIWADSSDIRLHLRRTPDHILIQIANPRNEPYAGTITYRGHDESLLHLHVNIGAQRTSWMLLKHEEIIGVACEGDASEGAWVIRSMRSSIVFNGGAGGVAPWGSGMILTAAHSGRFQLRHPDGWNNLQIERLLITGERQIAPYQVEGSHLIVPYIAEDQAGQTDLYLVSSSTEQLADPIDHYLTTIAQARKASITLPERNTTPPLFMPPYWP